MNKIYFSQNYYTLLAAVKKKINSLVQLCKKAFQWLKFLKNGYKKKQQTYISNSAFYAN